MPTGPVAVNVATGDLTYDSDLTGAGAGGEVTLDAASLAALESITVVDGGGTLSVDDGAGSLTVDAASLPLPTGASTAAKQAALGTAGTPSSDVLTVQGIASGTPQPIGGAVAAGAADSGNPVKVGGKYNSTLPTFSDGQRGDVQVGPKGSLRASLVDDASGTVGVVGGGNADGLATSNGLYVHTQPKVWNGSSWDRWQGTVKTLPVSAATLANVSGATSSTALFASNAAARGRVVHNDSAATLYLKFGTTASVTSFTAKLTPDAYYEFPAPLYTGAVEGIWTAATGAARTTEV